ncbi:MAG: septal ring lytic transglycosylase RlpA family protein [Gammaproteobacteria bacterium]|nr:septal ring lytic transglycosylase RlpA family protein [Gammaproteobacteria bacterium]
MAGVVARGLAVAALCATLAACGGLDTIRPRQLDPDNIADAVPGDEPRSAYGNPDSYVVDGKRYYTLRTAEGFAERGIASWYGDPFHGRRTSSGEVYDMYRMTAAHKQLPLPTYVQIRNLDNGRTATVKVNDRGPFKDNRVIDLSYAAALKLGVVAKGTAFVEIRALNARGEATSAPAREVATAPSPAVTAPVAPAPAVVAGAPARIVPPTPATRPPPAPPVTQSVAVSGMYLQAGAYADRRNAEKLRLQLAEAVTSRVEIREIKSNNKVFYRVQVGPLPSTDVADKAVAALEKLGITQHYFITN